MCIAGAGGLYFFRPSRPGPQKIVSSYADPKTCAACHPAIAKTYALTGMGRSFAAASAANTRGDGKTVSYYHQPSASYFTMEEREGRFYQGRYQIGFDKQKTNVIEKPIDFVLGSGNHSRAFLTRTSRGTLVELPLAWYAEDGGSWAMNPGYDRPGHPGFRRELTYACVFCHNGYPAVPAAAISTAPVFESLPEGIDCQRCHGPGGEHVRRAGTSGAKPEEIRAAIVNPARLSKERQLEVCMQCHLETTSFPLPNAIVRYERGPFSYQPGEPLSDFILHFDQSGFDSGVGPRMEIAGAAYNLRRSLCFVRSESLTCTSCHNPHDIPRGEAATQRYTAVCRQCHTTKFNQQVAAGWHTAAEDCIGCHMPKRRTEDVVHVVMTDHRIQRRKPVGDLLAPRAERGEKEAKYIGPVVPYYPRTTSKGADELYDAIAQVSHESNLTQGTALLTAAIEKYRPDRIEYYLHLGDAWTDGGDAKRSLPLYEEAVRRKPDSLIALQKLGGALRSMGQLPQSVEIFERAVELAPGDAATWQQLGLVYLEQGSKPEAIAAFERAIAADPDMAEAHNSLGGVHLENGEAARAEAAFREAIRIQPEYAEAQSNLGNALAAAGRFDEARFHLEAALRSKPDFTGARYNLALALARSNRLDESQRHVEQLLRTDPKSAEGHDLLGNLLVEKGQVRAALDHFRTAVQLQPDFGRAQLDLGSLLADAGDVEGAVPHLRKAAASSIPGVREEAAQILLRLGRPR